MCDNWTRLHVCTVYSYILLGHAGLHRYAVNLVIHVHVGQLLSAIFTCTCTYVAMQLARGCYDWGSSCVFCKFS